MTLDEPPPPTNDDLPVDLIPGVEQPQTLEDRIIERVTADPMRAFEQDVLSFGRSLMAEPVLLERFLFRLKRARVPVTNYRNALRAQAVAKQPAAQPREEEEGFPSLDFAVERVTVEESETPIYRVLIEGRELVMDSSTLMSPTKFAQMFLDRLHRVPRMPGRSKKEKQWREWVNEWLAGATYIRQSPEASRSFALKTQIAAYVDGLLITEDPDEMDAGKAFLISSGLKAFKKAPAIAAIRNAGHASLADNVFCSLLRDLDCVSKTIRVPSYGVYRAWIAPRQWPITPREEEAEDVIREPGSDDE